MPDSIIFLCAAAAMWGCYDDSNLWNKVNDHDRRLEQIETQLRAAANHGKTIAGVVETTTGWTITFDDGSKIDIKHGADGKDGDSSSIRVDSGDDNVEFTLADGTVIDMPRLNYSSSAGAFLLNEGTGQHGSVVWFDGNHNEHRDIYEKANGGRHVGQYLQDMFIADGKIYLLCQAKGDGDGQLLVCDARSMKLLKSYSDLDFGHDAVGKGSPQHLVVVGDKAFIQYATDDKAAGWENFGEGAAGIRVFDLATGTLRETDIAGTYGPFGVGTTAIPCGGALKARMLYSRGKVIAGLAKGFAIIDPTTEAVTHTEDLAVGVKDIVKGADGNLYIAGTGPFEVPQSWGEPNPKGSAIYKYSQQGEIQDGLLFEKAEAALGAGIFSTATWATKVSMCADMEDSYIYFNAGDKVARYDYQISVESVAVKWEYVELPHSASLYGYMGVHPERPELFVPTSVTYNPLTYASMSRLVSYDLFKANAPERVFDTFSGYKGYTSMPAGVWFTGQFTAEYYAK